MKKNLVIGLLLVCVGVLVGMMLTKSCSIKQTEIPQADTVTVVKIDTVTHYKPVPIKTTTLGEYSFDKYTPYAFFTDTIETVKYEQGYTFYQEVKEYKDSTYYAKISGINAFLEEIDVYPKMVTKYITNTITKEPDKWLLTANAGLETVGDNHFAKLGGKLQYRDKGNIFSLEGGREFIKKQWYTGFKYERVILGW